MVRSREWQLLSRPQGWPKPADFSLEEVEVGPPADGEVLVRNVYMSVDPYMRGRMNDGPSYAPPYQLGKPMYGGAVGVVEASTTDTLPKGTCVRTNTAWQEYAVVPASRCEVVDPAGVGMAAYLGVLGMPGMTAYVGLFDIGQPKPGETVFVSAASGAVGSLVGQLARQHGCRVVGSAGNAEKVEWLTGELGFDAAFDYHGGDVLGKLREAAPDGVDVYFDNVGGEQLGAAIECMNPFGRIAACGMISQYNERTGGPANLPLVVGKRIRLQGFIVSDHADRAPAFLEHVGGLLRSGAVRYRETVVDGIEGAVQALLDVLEGGHHLGKMVVRLSPEEA